MSKSTEVIHWTYSPSSQQQSSRQGGFTIIELIIIIVVVGILAAIGIPAYNNIQRKAASSSVVSYLRQITQRAESKNIHDGQIPQTIDDLSAKSPDVQVVYVTAGSGSEYYYSNLTNPQNGLLFYEHCRDLVSEGYGNGQSDFGAGTVAYISGCHVYDIHYIQINGWSGGFNISNPSVTEAMLQGYINNAITSNPDHPSYHETIQTFMDELILRFTSEGGRFPITEFWRPWLGAPTLPPPEVGQSGPSEGYCIIGTHIKYNDISYVTTSSNLTPRAGASCS